MKIVRTSQKYRVEITRDFSTNAQRFRWRVRSTVNGKIVSTSGEAFWRKSDIHDIVSELHPHLPVVEV